MTLLGFDWQLLCVYRLPPSFTEREHIGKKCAARPTSFNRYNHAVNDPDIAVDPHVHVFKMLLYARLGYWMLPDEL